MEPLRTVRDTRPYAWPWDGDLDGPRLAVLVLGNDPQWRTTSSVTPAIAENIAAIAAAAEAIGAIVIGVSHPCSESHLTSERHLARLASTPVSLGPSTQRIASAGIDGFYGSPLDALLRSARRDQLVLVGFGLEGPVHSTMRSANDRGYECLLVTDACSPVEDGDRQAAVSMVTMSGGIFGAVGTTASLGEALAAIPTEGVAP